MTKDTSSASHPVGSGKEGGSGAVAPPFDQGRAAPTALNIARELAAGMRCNCDLDNWEPTKATGHSWVCRIHRAAIAEAGA